LLECRHRFNEYYSWINSLKDVEKIDSHCIHRSRNLIELMCLSEALKLNVTQDKVDHYFSFIMILFLLI